LSLENREKKLKVNSIIKSKFTDTKQAFGNWSTM